MTVLQFRVSAGPLPEAQAQMHGPPGRGHQKEERGDFTAAGAEQQEWCRECRVDGIGAGAGPGSQGWLAHDGQSAACQVPGNRDAFQAGAAPASQGGGVLMHAAWSRDPSIQQSNH